jgi:hypothetical protein
MHCLSSLYRIIMSLNVSCPFIAYNQGAASVFVANGVCFFSMMNVGGPGWLSRPTDGQLRKIDMQIWGPTAPMHLGLKERALCVLPLVFPVISRGAPRRTT